MCGRFVVARASAELIADYEVDTPGNNLPDPSWNIPPTTRIPLLIDSPQPSNGDATPSEPPPHDARTRRLEAARWGLVPRWAKDLSVGVRAFNARSETAASKPTFRSAVAKRRAAVPASGYYEWHTRADGSKQPHYIHGPAPDLLMAGLYEWWRDPNDPDAEWVLSTSILTREATGELASIHHRMPVFLDRERLSEWLDPHLEGNDALIRDFAAHGSDLAQQVQHFPVDRRVGNVRVNDPGLIEPITTDEP